MKSCTCGDFAKYGKCSHLYPEAQTTAPKGSVERPTRAELEWHLGEGYHGIGCDLCCEVIDRLAERDSLKGEVEQWKSLVLSRTQHMNDEHERADTAESALAELRGLYKLAEDSNAEALKSWGECRKELAALKEKWGPLIAWAENILSHDCQCYLCGQVRAALAVRDKEGKK